MDFKKLTVSELNALTASVATEIGARRAAFVEREKAAKQAAADLKAEAIAMGFGSAKGRPLGSKNKAKEVPAAETETPAAE